MNDFTIEELFMIRSLINSNDPKLLTSSEKAILVQSKIQSMIDNYCEHDFADGCSHCAGLVPIACVHCDKEID